MAEGSVIGAALDGVYEAVCAADARPFKWTVRPRSVIALAGWGDLLLSGMAAERCRTGIGLPWPPDSRVEASAELRRVPVPIMWRGLREGRDGRARWAARERGGVPFSDLLAAHVAAALAEFGSKQQVVLAIPNSFSDFSQQRLLDSLRRSGLSGVSLLWCPVALALDWLAQTEEVLQLRSDTDSLLVLHVGPAGVDCATFRLREERVGGVSYIVPVRRPVRQAAACDAFDLAAVRVDEAATELGIPVDLQALWYGLSLARFWSPIASNEVGESLGPWYRDGRWELLREQLFSGSLHPRLPTSPPPALQRLLERHGVPLHRRDEPPRWGDLVDRLLNNQLSDCEGELRGAIVSGMPFHFSNTEWMAIVERCLSGHLKKRIASCSPEPDGIWNASTGEVAIARGAALFGQRVQRELPTYFDTLPGFDVYALTPDGGSWEPLVRDRETPGGCIYKHAIKKEFRLSRRQSNLNVYLRLYDGDNASIKRTQFHFPRGPVEQMPLDLDVEVRPAGGLAVVEMVPEDREFLGGVQVYLDYEEMEEVDEVPEVELGCPPIKEPHEVDASDIPLFRAGYCLGCGGKRKKASSSGELSKTRTLLGAGG